MTNTFKYFMIKRLQLLVFKQVKMSPGNLIKQNRRAHDKEITVIPGMQIKILGEKQIKTAHGNELTARDKQYSGSHYTDYNS